MDTKTYKALMTDPRRLARRCNWRVGIAVSRGVTACVAFAAIVALVVVLFCDFFPALHARWSGAVWIAVLVAAAWFFFFGALGSLQDAMKKNGH